MRYKLGIIIPYYNNNDICETLFKHLMFEINRQMLLAEGVKIVVIEDGQTSKWLDEYKSNEIVIKRLKKNQGVAHARNVGLDLLIDTCDYIAFIDSDDMIGNDYIDRLSKYASDGTHELIETYLSINDRIQRFNEYNEHRNCVWSYAIKSSVIGDKRFDEKLQVTEDTDFMYRVIDFKKHRKILCNTTYYYNMGANNNSLIMKYRRKEIEVRKKEV